MSLSRALKKCLGTLTEELWRWELKNLDTSHSTWLNKCARPVYREWHPETDTVLCFSPLTSVYRMRLN